MSTPMPPQGPQSDGSNPQGQSYGQQQGHPYGQPQGQAYGQQPMHGAQPAAYPAPKKKRTWLWVLLAALILIPLLLLGGCLALLGAGANEIDKQSKKEHTITYKVTSDGPVTVTYGKSGSTSTADSPKGTWTKDEKVTGFDFASVSVTNDIVSGSKGKVTCEILVDGQVKETKSASGEAATATCSASS